MVINACNAPNNALHVIRGKNAKNVHQDTISMRINA